MPGEHLTTTLPGRSQEGCEHHEGKLQRKSLEFPSCLGLCFKADAFGTRRPNETYKHINHMEVNIGFFFPPQNTFKSTEELFLLQQKRIGIADNETERTLIYLMFGCWFSSTTKNMYRCINETPSFTKLQSYTGSTKRISFVICIVVSPPITTCYGNLSFSPPGTKWGGSNIYSIHHAHKLVCQGS